MNWLLNDLGTGLIMLAIVLPLLAWEKRDEIIKYFRGLK